nr:maestro heat-like repeat-containing protein family member 7 [Pogona vitticeps]
MEKTREKLVSRYKDSAELLTQPCLLTTSREASESPPPDFVSELCMSQAIPEVTSSKVHEMMVYDAEIENENVDSGKAALDDYNKRCQISPRELCSKTSRNDNQKFCCQNQKLQFVEQIMTQIAALPMDHIDERATSLRCQGMLLVEDLSQVESSLWVKEKLLSISIASVFALPSVDTLQRQARKKVNVQALYDQTVEAMEAMLRCLLSKNPNATELLMLLDHLAPWMTSGQAHERARTVNTYVSLLKFAATCPTFHMSPEFPKLGRLIGQLCLRVNDPRKEIGQQAYISCLEMETDSLETEHHQRYKEIPGTYNLTRPHQNITNIIKAFEPHLTSRQTTELLLTALGCLKEANKHTTAASHTITSAIMKCYKHKLQEQVPDIVDQVHQQLSFVYRFRDRQIMMRVISQLAHSYMAEVCGALLQGPFPMTRFSAEIWCMLTKTCSDYELTVLVKVLLKELQLNPKATGNYITPLAAASAFCKVLSMPKCSDVALYIYPQLLMALLVQVHYHIRHNSVAEEECEPVR